MPAARRNTCACRSPTSARSRCPSTLSDEQVLFLSDILPTGYMAAENCDIQRRRHRCGLGLRSGRPVLHQERAAARRCARHRHRPLSGTPAQGARRRRGNARLRRRRRAGGAAGDDRRARAGCLHRRGRHGGAPARLRRRLRPGQAGDAAADRSTRRAAPGDHGLSQRRHCVRPGRVRRLRRQAADRRRGQQGAHDQERADARAPVHEAAARADRERRHRPVVHHLPPPVARRRAARLRAVPQQAGTIAPRSCSRPEPARC